MYKYLHKIRGVFLLLLLVLSVLLIALEFGFFNIAHVEFNDIEDAKRRNYWHAGSFLPQWIPKTSKTIRLNYDYDTDYIHFILKYDSQEEYEPPKECKLIGKTTNRQINYECKFVEHPYAHDCKLRLENGEFELECIEI